jgi:simple sugar transport system permease protein
VIDLVSILRYAAPIGFTTVGEAVGQKAGVINIGLEGTMLASAYAAMEFSLSSRSPWVGLVAGALVGFAVSMVSGLMTVKMRQDQVVVGTAVNLLSFGICGTLFEKSRGATGQLLSLPSLPKLYGGLDVALIILLALSVALSVLLAKSSWGLRVRAAGEYPASLEAAGYSVDRTRIMAVGIGGVLAGFGGAYYAIGVAGSFAPDMISGRGFMAIALVTFARWKPAWGLVGACLVGYFEGLQYQLQMTNQDVPKSLLIALPYVATLLILIFSGKGGNAPESLGEPYKGMR